MAVAITLVFRLPIASAGTSPEALLKEEEVFTVVGGEAEHICGSVSEIGSNRTIDWSAELEEGGLPEAIRRLVGLGVSGAAKFQSSEWTGVLQKDLALALQDTRDCKQHVFDTMTRKLFPTDATADANRTIAIDTVTKIGDYTPGSGSNPEGSSLTYVLRGPFREKNGSARISLTLGDMEVGIKDDIGVASPPSEALGGISLTSLCLDSDSAIANIVYLVDSGGTSDPYEYYLGRYDKALHVYRFVQYGSAAPQTTCKSGQASDFPDGPYPKTIEICDCPTAEALSISKMAADFAETIAPRHFSEMLPPPPLDSTPDWRAIADGEARYMFFGMEGGDVINKFLQTVGMLPDRLKGQFEITEKRTNSFSAKLIKYMDEDHERWAAIVAEDLQNPESWTTLLFDSHADRSLGSEHSYPMLEGITTDGKVEMIVCGSRQEARLLVPISGGGRPDHDDMVKYVKVSDTSIVGSDHCDTL